MSTTENTKISVLDFANILRGWWKYFLSKWKILLVAFLLFAITGVLYAWFQKPIYTAELSFSSENTNQGRLGGYAGLAAQFGLDLSGGGGSLFEGDNLIELLRSRLLVEKTLLTSIPINGKTDLLVNYYIKANEYDKRWEEDG